MVAQRDGQAAMLTVLAVLTSGTARGPHGRVLSALLMALAFTLRPHPILFAPAVLSAIDEGGRLPGLPPRLAFCAVVEWLAAFAVFVAVAFSPVVLAGVVPDWLRGLRVVSYGGPYSKLTLADMRTACMGRIDVGSHLPAAGRVPGDGRNRARPLPPPGENLGTAARGSRDLQATAPGSAHLSRHAAGVDQRDGAWDCQPGGRSRVSGSTRPRGLCSPCFWPTWRPQVCPRIASGRSR